MPSPLQCAGENAQTNELIRTAQMCWAVVCTCQAVFMLLRFPKVGWEPIFMPLIEACLYFLASSGIGYIRLIDGRYIPWARDAAWLCTTPVLLMQINGLTEVKWRHWSLNILQVSVNPARLSSPIARSSSLARLSSPVCQGLCENVPRGQPLTQKNCRL